LSTVIPFPERQLDQLTLSASPVMDLLFSCFCDVAFKEKTNSPENRVVCTSGAGCNVPDGARRVDQAETCSRVARIFFLFCFLFSFFIQAADFSIYPIIENKPYIYTRSGVGCRSFPTLTRNMRMLKPNKSPATGCMMHIQVMSRITAVL